MEISHSTKDANLYQIFCGKFQIGAAKKTEEGFHGQSILGDDFETKTMKALKEKFAELADSLEGLKSHLTSKPFYITVDDARKLCGLSHNAIKWNLRELSTYHPYLKPHQYGAAMVKLAYQAAARWDWGKTERQWLIDHAAELPAMKTLDWDASERNKRPIYID